MKRKASKILTCFVVLVLLAVNINVLPVSAGKSHEERNASSIGDDISMKHWYDVNGDLLAENGVLIFPDSSEATTGLVTRNGASSHEVLDVVATVQGNMKFTNLPEGKKFILAFGLDKIQSVSGDAGNLEVEFYNENGLCVNLVYYEEDGTRKEIVASAKAGSIANASLNVEISKGNKMTLQVGGKTIYKGETPCDGGGRIGFFQTGSCGVRISNLNVTTYRYDTPENANIFEDFEKETIDTSVLYSTMLTNYSFGQGLNPELGIVELEDGNHGFKFEALQYGYLGTKYEYSNFELSFDVPYVVRKDVINEDGLYEAYRCNKIAIAWGGDTVVYDTPGYENSNGNLFLYYDDLVTDERGYKLYTSSTFPFWTGDKPFSVKLRVYDGDVTLWMKWIEDKEWIEVTKYELPVVTGTIQIWGMYQPNFIIDNLSITNLDESANLIETKYTPFILDVPEDFDYKEEVMPYYDNGIGTSIFGIKPVILLAGTAGVCVLVIGGQLLAKKLCNRKGKEGAKDEE